MKIPDEQLKALFDVKEYPLDDKGMYDGFEKPFGKNFRPEWIPREDTGWWVEDLVLDLLKKEKIFGDRQLLLTRHLTGKKIDSQKLIFKGPLSKTDLWIPGYAFVEIKYAGNNQRDQWGYDLDNRSMCNIMHLHYMEQHYSNDLWKNNKLFLIIVHEPDPGDKVSVSIIDILDKCEFTSPWSGKKAVKTRLHGNLSFARIDVNKGNCMRRFDGVPYRRYRERGYEKKY